MASKGRTDCDFFNGEWLRELTGWEKCFYIYNRNHNFLIWYQLNLKSKSPLCEEDVRTALYHLYRKAANYSFCIGEKDGELWLRRATNPEIDFQVIYGGSIEEVKNCLHRYNYNYETGPLFCARLLIDPCDSTGDSDDLEPDFQHKSYLLFGIVHAFTDGTSNTFILGRFMSMLNDVISRKPINDEPIGTFVSDVQTLDIVNEKKVQIMEDPDLKRKLLIEKEKLKTFSPCLIEYFEKPSGEECATSAVEKSLDANTISKFRKKCRQEDVSFNSAFSAIANAAFVDLCVEKGAIHDSYTLQNLHFVNLRRYWRTKNPDDFGLHIGYPLVIYKETPKNVSEQFWDYARSLHQEIYRDLESGKSLETQALESLNSPKLQFEEGDLIKKHHYVGDFATANMGDITSRVTEGGEHVKVTDVGRASTLHLAENPLEIDCHTFRGKFTMNVTYNTAAVRKDVAEKFADKVVHKLKELVNLL